MAEYAGQQYPSTAPVQARPPSVASSVEDFDPVIGRLETLANRAMVCGDRISGSRPSGVEGAEKHPSPNHLLSAIAGRRDRLVRVVDNIEAEIQRIETGLGVDRN